MKVLRYAALPVVLFCFVFPDIVRAQVYPLGGGIATSQTGARSIPPAAQTSAPRSLPTAPMASTQDSVQNGVASPIPIALKLIDAVHRGLQSNLAVIVGALASENAEAA